MYLSNNTNKTLICIGLYLTLLMGFYFGENTSGGAYDDFVLLRIPLIESFKNDFSKTFLNYAIIRRGNINQGFGGINPDEGERRSNRRPSLFAFI